jgi:hypothetical protein
MHRGTRFTPHESVFGYLHATLDDAKASHTIPGSVIYKDNRYGWTNSRQLCTREVTLGHHSFWRNTSSDSNIYCFSNSKRCTMYNLLKCNQIQLHILVRFSYLIFVRKRASSCTCLHQFQLGSRGVKNIVFKFFKPYNHGIRLKRLFQWSEFDFCCWTTKLHLHNQSLTIQKTKTEITMAFK